MNGSTAEKGWVGGTQENSTNVQNGMMHTDHNYLDCSMNKAALVRSRTECRVVELAVWSLFLDAADAPRSCKVWLTVVYNMKRP